MLKKVEIPGIGVFIEIYRRDDHLSEAEMIVQACKALQREVLRRELNSGNGPHRPNDNHVI